LNGQTTVAVNTSSGQATFSGLSIDKAGAGYTLTATGSTVSTTPGTVVSNAFNITAGAVNSVTFVQEPRDTVAGQNITPAVTVRAQDSFGNNVSGASVVISKTSGTGTLSGTLTQTTNSNGVATFANLSINLIGAKVLTATSNAKTTASDSFSITAAAANKVVFVQPPTTATAGQGISPAVTVQLQDLFSNKVSSAGVSITMVLTTGTGTLSGTTTQLTEQNGLATFSDLSIKLTGTKKLTASAGALSVDSNAFTITAAAVNTVAFVQQPTDTVAGQRITPAVTVQARDQFGNDVPNVSVTMSKSSGTGTLSGTLTQSTDASGIGTFGNLSINQVGPKNLTATSNAKTAVSAAFTITAGAANKLGFGQQPTTTTVGQTISPAMTVQVQDSFGNLVPTDNGRSITMAI